MKRTRLRRKTPLRVKSERQEEHDALHDLLRRVVLLRDGFRCRKCGVTPHSRPAGVGGVVLQAAHIYGKGAHPAMRYVTDNVLTLCKPCHFWWHRRGFGREAAAENQVRKWCLEALGETHMRMLDVMAGSKRGGADLDVARILLQRELERMTAPPPIDHASARHPREFDL